MKLCLLLATALLTLPAAAADQLSCPVPQGVRATANMNDLPSGLHRAVERDNPGISPPGGPFDATDVIQQMPPHFERVMFVWSRGNTWLIATQHGGIAYSEAFSIYKLVNPADPPQVYTRRVFRRDRFCNEAAAAMQAR